MTETVSSAVPVSAADAGTDPREVLGERIVSAMTETMESFAMALGIELGLYAALGKLDSATPGEFATAANIHERYAREWLEQQAAAGILTVDNPDAAADDRRFALTAEHAEVLLDEDSPYFAGAGPVALLGTARVLTQVAEAYRTGGGVPYADYGREMRWGIAAFNRPMFLHDLGSSWLPSIPEVHERLSQPGARVLDFGCGAGASTIAIAQAYPSATVLGVDLDEASIADARVAADRAGVAERVNFICGDAVQVRAEGPFDLVTLFEALHDMGDGVGALRMARSLLAPGGSVLIADERSAETFTAPGDELERFLYGWSVTHCLPATMAEHPVEAAGTAIRPDVVLRWGRDAGFGRGTVLDIENPFWRFFRLSD